MADARDAGAFPIGPSRIVALSYTTHFLTGIHAHITQLRLRKALDLLEDSERGIAELAVTLGFSSHSHLTSAFSETFGFPPSRYRAGPNRQLRTILKV